eukprot:6100328-Prorocentrum_lima.AAC.1
MPLDRPQSCEERRAHPATTPIMLGEQGMGRGGEQGVWKEGRMGRRRAHNTRWRVRVSNPCP